MKNKVLELLYSNASSSVILSGAKKLNKGDTYKEKRYYFESYPNIKIIAYTDIYNIAILDCDDDKLRKYLFHKVKRYFWIAALFNPKAYKNTLFDFWKTKENIQKTYKKEKTDIEKDEWILLYWLLHFGLLGDFRTFNSLKQKVSLFDNGFLNDAILLVEAFLSNSKDLDKNIKDRFYNKIWETALKNSYESSLLSYKYSNEGTNKKVYWIVKNVNLENTWDKLNEDIKNFPKDKRSISYILANNPFVDEKIQKENATKYLKEMEKNIQEYSMAINSVVSIYNLYKKIDDLGFLYKISKLYFDKVLERHFRQDLVDYFNEIIFYLKNEDQSINNISFIDKTILEIFDELGYKQIELSLFEKDAMITAYINNNKIYSGSLYSMVNDSITPKEIYDKFIKHYKKIGFQEVIEFGVLDKLVPRFKRPRVIATRMDFDEFKNKYPNINVEDDWWNLDPFSICVYKEKFISKYDINLNDGFNIFNRDGFIFLDDLEVKGDILNDDMEHGSPIFVQGKTIANSISAGGAYLHFEGGLEVKNALVTHYNDGSLIISKFLKIKVFFDNGDHYLDLPNKLDIDYYYSYDNHSGIKSDARNVIKDKDLLIFRDEKWVKIEDIDYSECDNKDKKEKKSCIDDLFIDSFHISFSTIAELDLKQFADKIENTFSNK